MRKIICAFCVIAFTSLFLLNCSSDEYCDEYSEDDLELSIPEQYKIIGGKHNEGLEFAFEAIKSHYISVSTRNSSSKISVMYKEDLLALGKQAAIEFSVKNTSDVPEGFCAEIINKSEKIATRSIDSSVSPEVEAYIKMIDDALKNEPKSPNNLLAKLNRINEHASLNLSEQDAIAVYAGTATCYNSYIYWKENFMKWVIAIKFPELLAQYSDDELNTFQFIDGKLMAPKVATRGWWDDAWSSVGETWDSVCNTATDWWNNGGGKEVVGADAGGAVVGAMDGAWGGGPGAVAGGISGACYGSIGAAIAEWISK